MLHSRLDPEEGADDGVGPRHIVYVIDDERDLRHSSCFLIGTLGLECMQFPDGRTFLAEVEGLEPGCLLLDMWMEGLSGIDVQRALLQRGLNWPVIFMSGRRDMPALAEAARKGAVEFLDKPFDDEHLLAALHRGFVALRGEA